MEASFDIQNGHLSLTEINLPHINVKNPKSRVVLFDVQTLHFLLLKKPKKQT